MASDIQLKRYNYTTQQVEEIGSVSLYDLKNSMTDEQFAALISDYLNGHRPAPLAKAVGTSMAQDHPSLQHEQVAFLIQAVVNYGGLMKGRYTDDRNEGAARVAVMLHEMAERGELNIGMYI